MTKQNKQTKKYIKEHIYINNDNRKLVHIELFSNKTIAWVIYLVGGIAWKETYFYEDNEWTFQEAKYI